MIFVPLAQSSKAFGVALVKTRGIGWMEICPTEFSSGLGEAQMSKAEDRRLPSRSSEGPWKDDVLIDQDVELITRPNLKGRLHVEVPGDRLLR